MTITPDKFGAVIDEWKEWQSFPWGKLFYSTSQRNLQRHLPDRLLRILDVGGGNGMDSIYFARQGHSVVLLDYSSAMLAEARKAAEEQGVVDQITFLQADAEKLHELLSGQQFDLVLCNLMIEFVLDPQALLRELCHRLTPGGLLSLIDSNRYSWVFRSALLQNDLSAALQAVGTTQYPHRWVHRDVPLYSAEEMIQLLQADDCELAGQYGIWCICHYLPNERKFEAQYYAELEQLEHCLTGTYPYYLLARMFQVIVRKNGMPSA